MATENLQTATSFDIKPAGSEFSFVGKLAEMAKNKELVQGYESIVNPDAVKRNNYSFMWEALSGATEDSGNKLYTTIRNYVNEIGNIDTCNIKSLKNYANILSYDDDNLNVNYSFPSEILGLIEIFSVNRAYLYNKATDGSESSLALKNSILSSSTISQFLEALDDSSKYKEFIRNVFYNTMLNFINLKVGTFEDNQVYNYDELIWKTNISKFTEGLWDDDVTSDDDVYKLKEELCVSKSFTEKVIVDKIIAGESKLSDYSETEQKVLKAEIESRQNRYGNAPQMKYYFMRYYKVLEYIKFVSLSYKKIYELEQYDINDSKYTVTDKNTNKQLIKFNYTDYSIDTDIVRKVSEWLADYSIKISQTRTKMRFQSQKNMMIGTKKLIVDTIKTFIKEQVDSDTWKNFQTTTLFLANLNKNFDVSIVEYLDSTEYFNIESEDDALDSSKVNTKPRFWEETSEVGKSFSKDEILAFYNRLTDDTQRFKENNEDNKSFDGNLYEFLSLLFETGASNNVVSDVTTESKKYVTNGDTIEEVSSETVLSGDSAEAFKKFTGDFSVGYSPYANAKNELHPSYQIHPFLQGFEQYNEIYTGVMNLVNSFSDDISTSIARLTDRISSIGTTINFWYNWNEDFTGYSTTYEKGGSDSDHKLAQDGPFNFDALQEFINFPDEYILNILQGVNHYYLSELTGKNLFTEDEMELELSRLQKYKSTIANIANKAIYKYAKDKNGNIFILYKDEDGRNNKNKLGNIWVRLRNHPLAFPLFDVTESPSMFTKISCLSQTNNQKLLDMVSSLITRFRNTYGINGSDDGRVDASRLTLSFISYHGEGIQKYHVDSNGIAVIDTPIVKSNISASGDGYKLIQPNGAMILTMFSNASFTSKLESVVEPDDIDDSVRFRMDGAVDLCHTHYFVDTITNDVLSETDVVSSLKTGSTEYSIAENYTGRVIETPDENFASAVCTGGVLDLKRIDEFTNTQGFIFSDYTDTSDEDENITYYHTTAAGKVHPCKRRKIDVNSFFAVKADKFVGSIDENSGDVTFGKKYVSSIEKITAEDKTIYLNGDNAYEDFSKYTYAFTNPLTESVSSYKYNPSIDEENRIVMIGGSNPYYVLNNYDFDESGNSIPHLIKATRVSDGSKTRETDTFVFTDDNTYYTDINSSLTSYAFSDCTFLSPEPNIKIFDTVHQFQLRTNPYKYYYPYTTIDKGPTLNKEDLGDIEESYIQSITFYGDTTSQNVVFYYTLKSQKVDHEDHYLALKSLTMKQHRATKDNTVMKFGGDIELISDNASDYPIYLKFLNMDNDENVATYSTYYSENDYKKFFDMGFSYDQNTMYLAYRNGSDNYLDSGVIFGKIDEQVSSDFSHYLTFYRDFTHAAEEISPDNIYSHKYLNEKVSLRVNSTYSDVIYDGSIDDGITFKTLHYLTKERGDKNKTVAQVLGVSDSSYYQETLTYFQAHSADEGRQYGEGTPFYAITGNVRGIRNSTIGFEEFPISYVLSMTPEELKENELTTFVSSGDAESVFAAMDNNTYTQTYSDGRVSIKEFIENTMNEYYYRDSLETYHYGDVGSKSGVYSAYGKINEHSKVLSLTIYKMSEATVESNGYEIPLKFLPYDFSGTDDSKYGKYSFKLNCTENRLYLSFTSNLPDDDFEFSTTINGIGSGIGKSKFENIRTSGDCIITILSFDISNSSMDFMEDETRYIFKNGCLGYFPQYGGLHGKNVLFSNPKLSSDDVFSFIAEFEEMESGSDLNLYTSTDVVVKNGSTVDTNTIKFSKYISIDNSCGFSIGYDNTKGYLVTFSDANNVATSFSNVDGRSIKDISRGFGCGKFLISDGSNDGYLKGCIGYDTSTLTPSIESIGKIPVLSDSLAAFSVDFDSIFDVDEYAYSLHSDGRTFSKIGIGTSSDKFVSNGIRNYESKEIPNGVSTSFNSGNLGYSIRSGEKISFSKIKKSDDTIVVTVFNGATVKQYSIIHDGIELDDITTMSDGDIPMFIYDFGNDLQVKKEIFYIHKFGDTSEINPEEGHISSFNVEPAHSKIKAAIDTKEDNVKMLFTKSQRCYMLTISINPSEQENPIYAQAFDDLVDRGILSKDDKQLDNVETIGGKSYQNNLFGYYSSEQNASGLVYVRHDTPDSVGIDCEFFDSDGNETSVSHISGIISRIRNVIVVDRLDNGTDIVYLSTDDGKTFNEITALGGHQISAAGCSIDRMFAVIDNDHIISSSDGESWVSECRYPYSTWNVHNSNGNTFVCCNSEYDISECSTCNYVNIISQCYLAGDYDYDGLVVDGDYIIAYSGIDGTHPLSIARSFDGVNFEYFTFSNIRGVPFTKGGKHGENVMFAPDGGSKVLILKNAFSKGESITYSYSDISETIGSNVVNFGGFVEINGNLLMYPTYGSSILVYNDSDEKFYSYYSFPTEISFSDADVIDVDDTEEVILSPNYSYAGHALWISSEFNSKDDYGVVEINNGFPISVTYTTAEETEEYNIKKITFTFMNDEGNAFPLSIYTYSGNSEIDAKYRHAASGSYAVNNKVVIYRFDAIDSDVKYKITRNDYDNVVEYDNTKESSYGEYGTASYLSVALNMSNSDRTGIMFEYNNRIGTDETNICYGSVYDGFSYPPSEYQFTFDNCDSAARAYDKRRTISEFEDYSFTSTIQFKGNFGALNVPVESTKELVSNSNFGFSKDCSVYDATGMFSGCKNAIFTESLVLTSDSYDNTHTIRYAGAMFSDCVNAKIPIADIKNSGIREADSMFANCYNAVLANVDIPKYAYEVENMFKNCKNASLDTVSTIRGEIVNTETDITYRTNMTGMFDGCYSATLENINFKCETVGEKNQDYTCDYMFRNCEMLNGGNINFPEISPYIKSADYMFADAGANGSLIMDNAIIRFSGLHSGNNLFTGSNFSFNNTVIQFGNSGASMRFPDGGVTIDGISEWFNGCKYMINTAPTIVLSDSLIDNSNIETSLTEPLTGHYVVNSEKDITGLKDFGSLFKDSRFKTVDLRGISNNSDLDYSYIKSMYSVGVQDCSNMFNGCENLTTVTGCIPLYAKSCKNMFNGCCSLENDISEMFKSRNIDWKSEDEFTKAFAYDSECDTAYHMTDISGMFNGCTNICCKDDAFDLGNVVNNVVNAIKANGETPSISNFDSAFSFNKSVAFSTRIEGLENVNYDLDNISANGRAIRYCTYGTLDDDYGLGTNYPAWVFKSGLLRYGGELRDGSGYTFSVIYKPVFDKNGDVLSIEPITTTDIKGLIPDNFDGSDSDKYSINEIDTEKNEVIKSLVKRGKEYYSFKVDKLFGAAIFDDGGNFVRYAYVGQYTKTRNFKVNGHYTAESYASDVTTFSGSRNSEIAI